MVWTCNPAALHDELRVDADAQLERNLTLHTCVFARCELPAGYIEPMVAPGRESPRRHWGMPFTMMRFSMSDHRALPWFAPLSPPGVATGTGSPESRSASIIARRSPSEAEKDCTCASQRARQARRNCNAVARRRVWAEATSRDGGSN